MDENPYGAPQELATDSSAKRRMPPWFGYIALALTGLAVALNGVGLFEALTGGYAGSRADVSPREQVMAVVVAGVLLLTLSLNLWLLGGRDRIRNWVRVVISVVGNAVLVALFSQTWPFAVCRCGPVVPSIECLGSISTGTVSVLAIWLRPRVTKRQPLVALLTIVVAVAAIALAVREIARIAPP